MRPHATPYDPMRPHTTPYETLSVCAWQVDASFDAVAASETHHQGDLVRNHSRLERVAPCDPV
eukprot:660216-Prymnesium_polylepis.2